MTIRIVTRGVTKRIEQLLRVFGTRGLRKIGNEARDLVNLSIGDAFESASDPITGRKWKRRKKRYPHRPLQKTGLLRGSTRAGYRLSGNRIGVFVAIKGKAREYGMIHQEGSIRMPRRRFIGFSPKYRKRLLRKVDSLLRK